MGQGPELFGVLEMFLGGGYTGAYACELHLGEKDTKCSSRSSHSSRSQTLL